MAKLSPPLIMVLMFLHSLATAPAQLAAQEPDPRVAAFVESLEPGDAHGLLARMQGEWMTSQKVWMSPDRPPSITTGTATGSLRFGGRFLFLEINGVSLAGPVTVVVVFGYDNYHNRYEAAAVGENSTAMYTSNSASCSIDVPPMNAVELCGEMDDPFGKRPVRYVYRVNDDGSLTADVYDTENGAEILRVQTTFKRAEPDN